MKTCFSEEKMITLPFEETHLPPSPPPTHTFQLTPYFQAIFNDPLFVQILKTRNRP